VSRRVILLRGRQVNPWELGPWESLGDGYEVEVAVAGSNVHDVSSIGLATLPARTLSERLPGALVRVPGDRYLGLASLLRGADIVHAAELGTWFSWQAAGLRSALGYRLVLTVWETLPLLDAYRNVRTRRYRRAVLAATDLYLAATERARSALLLEGAPEDRVRVCPPGIDTAAFATARSPRARADGARVVLTVARLEWEKGVQDLLRALALLDRSDVVALIVGDGPQRGRLERHARELGVRAEFRGAVAYERMPELYAQASCFVLGSLATWSWEEQFGLVLAEAMAAHLPIVAAHSGAIGEVLGGAGTLYPAGDWRELAALLGGVLDGEPRADPGAVAQRYTLAAAAGRLRDAYDAL
jgi:glycosyltransferase involved in cell wall biosynthesis